MCSETKLSGLSGRATKSNINGQLHPCGRENVFMSFLLSKGCCPRHDCPGVILCIKFKTACVGVCPVSRNKNHPCMEKTWMGLVRLASHLSSSGSKVQGCLLTGDKQIRMQKREFSFPFHLWRSSIVSWACDEIQLKHIWVKDLRIDLVIKQIKITMLKIIWKYSMFKHTS